MAKVRFCGFFKSNNDEGKNQYYIYEPECEIRAIVQIVHGMCEHVEMYEPLIDFLCDHGIAVCAHDHQGHGNSVTDPDDYGYFDKAEGWKTLVMDVNKLNQFVRREYPDIPFFLLGHSMGSFVARLYTVCFGDTIDGAIYMGTSGPVFGTFAGICLVKFLKMIKGDRYRSKLVDLIAFGAYNKRYLEEKDAWAWLCHDRDFRKLYVTDERNSFIFTLSGFDDLLSMVHRMSVGKWYRMLPKDMPYLLLSGTEDPVGQYGKGVMKVVNKMRRHGCSNVTLKLYEGDRHVLIREADQDQVMKDLMRWLNHCIATKTDC